MFFEYQGWLISISHFNKGVRVILWHPLGHGSTQFKKKKKNQHSVHNLPIFNLLYVSTLLRELVIWYLPSILIFWDDNITIHAKHLGESPV